jgi:hypothetical protein
VGYRATEYKDLVFGVILSEKEKSQGVLLEVRES